MPNSALYLEALVIGNIWKGQVGTHELSRLGLIEPLGMPLVSQSSCQKKLIVSNSSDFELL